MTNPRLTPTVQDGGRLNDSAATACFITYLPPNIPGLDACAAHVAAKSVHLPHQEGRKGAEAYLAEAYLDWVPIDIAGPGKHDSVRRNARLLGIPAIVDQYNEIDVSQVTICLLCSQPPPLRQTRVLPVHVSNRPSSSTIPTHSIPTLDRDLQVNSVTRAR